MRFLKRTEKEITLLPIIKNYNQRLLCKVMFKKSQSLLFKQFICSNQNSDLCWDNCILPKKFVNLSINQKYDFIIVFKSYLKNSQIFSNYTCKIVMFYLFLLVNDTITQIIKTLNDNKMHFNVKFKSNRTDYICKWKLFILKNHKNKNILKDCFTLNKSCSNFPNCSNIYTHQTQLPFEMHIELFVINTKIHLYVKFNDCN